MGGFGSRFGIDIGDGHHRAFTSAKDAHGTSVPDGRIRHPIGLLSSSNHENAASDQTRSSRGISLSLSK
jgi:hypothetical protein